jgi:hypothetical protein
LFPKAVKAALYPFSPLSDRGLFDIGTIRGLHSRQIAKLQDLAAGLAQRIQGLVNENARTQMTENEFTLEH